VIFIKISGGRENKGHRIGRVVPKVKGSVLPQHTHGGGSQLKLLRRRHRKSQPTDAENAKKMPMGDNGAVSRKEAKPGDDAIDTPDHLFRRLATGAAMEK
jgi:hypothetical protein